MQFVLYYVVWFICLYNISCMFDKNIAHQKVAQPRRPSKNCVTVVNAHSHLEKSHARQSKLRKHFVTLAAPYIKEVRGHWGKKLYLKKKVGVKKKKHVSKKKSGKDWKEKKTLCS